MSYYNTAYEYYKNTNNEYYNDRYQQVNNEEILQDLITFLFLGVIVTSFLCLSFQLLYMTFKNSSSKLYESRKYRNEQFVNIYNII